MSLRWVLVLLMLAPLAAEGGGGPRLTPHAITLRNGKQFSLNLPEEFEISVAAEGLSRVRFFAAAPDGRIFVTDMYNRADNARGSVYILDRFDNKAGKFNRVLPYLTHLRNPNSLAFYTDALGQSWLYLALTDKLERFKFRLGEESPSSAPEVLATYPDYGLNYKYGGWHLTRTIVFGEGEDRNHLYITVGSSCNACEEKEEIRATLSVMDADGQHARILARGLRNAVGLRWADGSLFATNMGADHLGDAVPDDTMFRFDRQALHAAEPADYGWPYCYFNGGRVAVDPTFSSSSTGRSCQSVPPVFAFFPAHSSPLGLEYFGANNKSAALTNAFLIALHGSGKRRLQRGYRVVALRQGSPPQDLITGFLAAGKLYGRPCGILRMGEDSFLLSDDLAGVIYYVHRK